MAARTRPVWLVALVTLGATIGVNYLIPHVVHGPLTPKTRGMIGATQLQAMKKSAYFINIARGGLIKTDELVDALTKSRIAPEEFEHRVIRLLDNMITTNVRGENSNAA